MTLAIASPAFSHGRAIPTQYTGDGGNVVPPLSWSGVPEGTREMALIVEDPDAPSGTPFVHWLAYKIPPTLARLPEPTPAAALVREGTNSFGQRGYGGPAPPPGKVHHYQFRLYALDRALDLAPGADKRDVLDAMKGHVLAEAQLVGTYGRQA
jgi:Raf kinase inhibitor-like YbhB/YbcL family protein